MNDEFESESNPIEPPANSPTENSLTVFAVFATIAAVVFFAFGKRDDGDRDREIVPVGVGSPAPTDHSQFLTQPAFIQINQIAPVAPIAAIEPIPPYPLEVDQDASFREVCEILAIAESIIFVQDYRLKTISKTDPTEIRDREIVERDVVELIRERIERVDFDEMDERKEMYLRVLSDFNHKLQPTSPR